MRKICEIQVRALLVLSVARQRSAWSLTSHSMKLKKFFFFSFLLCVPVPITVFWKCGRALCVNSVCCLWRSAWTGIPAFVLIALRYKMCYLIFKKENKICFNPLEENRRNIHNTLITILNHPPKPLMFQNPFWYYVLTIWTVSVNYQLPFGSFLKNLNLTKSNEA